MIKPRVIGEIGINHNGSVDTALTLCDVINLAGCWAAKFQMRTPEICVPRAEWDRPKQTPWGQMTYLEYKKRMELSIDDYVKIDTHCRKRGLTWFASVWDMPALQRYLKFGVPYVKIASACLTNLELIEASARAGLKVFLSTGMSTWTEIDEAVRVALTYSTKTPVVMHSVSEYPCPDQHCNLQTILEFQLRYHGVEIGYSGHEEGVNASVIASTLGIQYLERHVTADKSMWGTDQSSSLDPCELKTLMVLLDQATSLFGSVDKTKVPEWELSAMRKLRG